MNSPGAIGASGAVLPFYNRGSVATTLLPQGVSSTLTPMSLTIPNVSLGATDTLVMAVLYNNALLADATGLSFAGVTVNAAKQQGFAVGVYSLLVGVYALFGTPLVGDIVADWTASTAPPGAAALFAMAAPIPINQGSPVDRTKSAAGTSATQDSGLFALATTHAVDCIFGAIGTSGSGGDALGTWQAPLAAYFRVSNAQMDLKLGVGLVAATGTYRSEVTGATSRPYGSICIALRGA